MPVTMTSPAINHGFVILSYDAFIDWQTQLNDEFRYDPEIDRVLEYAGGAIMDSVLEVIGQLRTNENGALTLVYWPSALLLAAAKATSRGDLAALCRRLNVTETSVIREAADL